MIFSWFSVLRMLDLQKLILGTMVGSSAPYETSPATNHYECRTPHETVRMMGYVGRKAPPPFAPKRPLVAARRACRRRCAAESATEPEGDARKGAGQVSSFLFFSGHENTHEIFDISKWHHLFSPFLFCRNLSKSI